MENQFALIKGRLFDVVEELSKINSNKDKRLGEITEKLTLEQFNLVVMGHFKRGKSTFINALIGAKILPTSIVPLTSIVTILRYGQESRAFVRYLDEKEEEIHLTDIPKFVTEKQNPKNKLHVKEVEILYPSDYLKDGVRIIDTWKNRICLNPWTSLPILFEKIWVNRSPFTRFPLNTLC